jgi:hypothetical protein
MELFMARICHVAESSGCAWLASNRSAPRPLLQQGKDFETAIAQHPRNFQGTVAQFTERLDEEASQIQIVRAQLEVLPSADLGAARNADLF